ncbi:MAG: Hpt domain-containing protein [Pararhodobacter sp.]
MSTPDSRLPAIDREVLESLFAMGDETLRVALSAQLLADFDRLKSTLATEEPSAVARTAHELKGLAATVGAQRLADMARSVDAVAEGMAADALLVVVPPLRAEIDAVLAHLRDLSAETP